MHRESTLGGRDATKIGMRKRSSNYFGAMSISLVIAAAESMSSRGGIAKSCPRDIPRFAVLFEAAGAVVIVVPSPRLRGEGDVVSQVNEVGEGDSPHDVVSIAPLTQFVCADSSA